MFQLVIGLVLFLGAHSISIVAEPWRDRMAARSPAAWKIGFGLVSLAGIWLIAAGYGSARLDPVVLWVPPAWTSHLVALLLLPVFVLFFATYLPGRIQSATKHPQLTAVKLWAVAHLLANGTLADVVLFGSFLAWAVADRISLKRRTQRPLPGPAPAGRNDAIAVVAGLGVYVLFVVWAHRALIGVAPFG